MAEIHDYPKTYPIREDSALRTPSELLGLLGWKIGDECSYQLDFSDPKHKKLIVSVKSENGQPVN